MAPRLHVPPELRRRPFTIHEARAAGLSREMLKGASWRRIGRGLYCWRAVREDSLSLLKAWTGLLPPDATFAGLTAAWLHGLDADPCHPIEVLVPPSSFTRSRAGLTVRHSLEVDAVSVRGLRATTLQRVFRDLRHRLSRVELLVLADAALRLGMGRFDELAEPAESPMETRLRWLLLQAGLPRPQVQANLHDATGRFVGRADLYYPSARLVIEYDGANHRDRLIEDDRRQNLLLNAGYRLLRFTAADVTLRSELLPALVRQAAPV